MTKLTLKQFPFLNSSNPLTSCSRCFSSRAAQIMSIKTLQQTLNTLLFTRVLCKALWVVSAHERCYIEINLHFCKRSQTASDFTNTVLHTGLKRIQLYDFVSVICHRSVIGPLELTPPFCYEENPRGLTEPVSQLFTLPHSLYSY